jgi:peroxiredoxin (alkyl hydroperoxide reductase subunit C)
MTLVGKHAPKFTAKAVVDHKISTLSLADFLGQYVVLFFYPLNFTFVCPTELHAFQEEIKAFESRGVQVIGCSVDSHYSHAAWLKAPKTSGGIEGVSYPLVSDIHKSIAKDYDVLNEEAGIAYRALFLIDQQGIIRHTLVNDLGLGRSVGEVLRLVDALIFHEKNGEVCPANWKAGTKGMKPTEEGLTEFFGSTKP